MRELSKVIISSVALLSAACATPAPKTERFTTTQNRATTSTPNVVTLDFREAKDARAVIRGADRSISFDGPRQRSFVKSVPAGRYTAVFHYGADYPGPNNGCDSSSASRTEKIGQAAYVTLASGGLMAPALAAISAYCAVKKATEPMKRTPARLCFRVKFKAIGGKTYLPKLARRRLAIIDKGSRTTVGVANPIPCTGAIDAIVAETGDPQAQYHLYIRNKGRIRWVWLCRAAHNGHLHARKILGDRYSSGASRQRSDLVEAFKWYALAGRGPKDSHGEYLEHISKIRQLDLLKDMTPAQIARAKRLAARWRPNPRECLVKRQSKRR